MASWKYPLRRTKILHEADSLSRIKDLLRINVPEAGTPFALRREGSHHDARAMDLENGRKLAAVPLLNRRSRTATDIQPAVFGEGEGIDAFASEESLAANAENLETPVASRADGLSAGAAGIVKWIAVILVSAAAAAGAMWVYERLPGQPEPGSLTLQTTPSGLQVAIGGKPMGTTPLTVSLPAGEYPVTLSAADGRQRSFAVTLSAGGSVVQQVELAAAPAPVAATGSLYVETVPARQAVMIDGIDRGFSPLTVSALSPGEHIVVVRTPGGTVRRTVAVKEGDTVSLVFAGAETPALRAGYVTFSSPISLELRENGSLVGTTESDRLMLAAGDHDIELINDALGFRATRRVTVAPDRTVSVAVEVPNGTININALPWAEVWVGGERVGETPIANLTRPIGIYEVLLRHPQFGERKTRLTVSSKQPTRLGVDMRTP
jgi:hypothetical protein